MNTEPIITRSPCPLCSSELVTSWVQDNIPFFGEVMYITSRCECGFRYSDTLILTQRMPMRYELIVKSRDDLKARVVRSTSGTIRIPELGIDVEPGIASESFVSNIEGVLEKVECVLEMVTRWGEEEKTMRAFELIRSIGKVREGEYEITVVIEDPMGNSAIFAKNATSRELTDEEAACLKIGMVVFEK